MIFQTILIQPFYNSFIYLLGIMPHGDVGFAIIALTLIMRIIFYPAFASSIKTQMGMQAIQGELDEINKKYKDNPDEKAKRTMGLFKEHGVKPLSGLLALVVQIPIFIALYWAFFREGLPKIATPLLYSFVHAPTSINLEFLGFVNLLGVHNITLALIVGFLQYLVTYYSLGRVKGAPKPTDPAKAAASRMQQQLMLYALPAFITIICYTLPAAAGLYWATGNVVSLGQEWLIRKQMRRSRQVS